MTKYLRIYITDEDTNTIWETQIPLSELGSYDSARLGRWIRAEVLTVDVVARAGPLPPWGQV